MLLKFAAFLLMNCLQDSDLLMEERTKENYPPEHQFLEYNSPKLNVPSNFSSNPSIRKTKKERKKTKVSLTHNIFNL